MLNREKILIVDDDIAIWSSYQNVLTPVPKPKTNLDELQDMFGLVDEFSDGVDHSYNLDSMNDYDLSFFAQGEEALESVRQEKLLSNRYAVAFIDIRMPPGWNGIRTAQEIRKIDSQIEIVIVTAYTDISRSKIVHDIGTPDKLLYLRKPFDAEELTQITLQLATKWKLYQQESEQQKKIKNLLYDNQKVRKYLDGIVDSMPSMLIGVSGEGWITHWNAQIEAFTQLLKKDTLNQPIEKILPSLNGIKNLIHRATIYANIEKKEKFIFSFTNVKKNIKQKLLCDIVIYPISVTDENSTLKNSAVIRIDDVTERVRLEEALLQSDKMLTVGGLAAGMAHEINTPLGSIIQNAQVITNRISPEKIKNRQQAKELGIQIEDVYLYLKERGIIQLLDGIRECGGRTSKLVKSMLSFSHKSSSMIRENLYELVEEAIHLSMNDYDMKKIYHFRDFDINIDAEPSLPSVVCERTKIEQVIMNLLKNAAQSMMEMPDDHKPKITIKISCKDDTAFIVIEDNGPGITKVHQKRIFDPFFTTKEVGVGTGLGLSLAYFIITKNHQGDIQVESEPDKGTRFIIHLPITKPE